MPVELPHLEELPDHHQLEHRADAARHDDEGVRDEHEVVQAREEGAVLEDLPDEGIDLLLEGQIDADTDRVVPARRAVRAPSLAACINPGPPPVTMVQPICVSSAASSRTAP